jgi:hypothetical protein
MNLYVFTSAVIKRDALTTLHVCSAYAVAKHAARRFGAVDIQRKETVTRLVETFVRTSLKATFITYFVCLDTIVTA